MTARSVTLRPAVDELITLSAAAVFYSRRIVRSLQVAWHKNVEKRPRIKAKPRSNVIFGDYRLYVHVCKTGTLREAYRLAQKNNGAPGIDGVSFEAIEGVVGGAVLGTTGASKR